MISIVFPCYNEAENVKELHQRIMHAVEPLGVPYEIIAIEHGSTDGTLERLKECIPIKIIVFTRNFGQTSALDAGIHAAKGDVIITMDADLQNDPSDIPILMKKIDEGYDCVAGWRKERKDSLGRWWLSKMANWLTRTVTGVKLHDFACALKAFRREFMQGVHLYGEMHVFLPVILNARGARVTEIPVKHHERTHGVSKHYFMKAVKDIADLFTIKFLFSYAARPLVFFGGWGVLSIVVALVSAGIAITSTYVEGIHIIESPYTLLASMFLILGFILFMIGFIAELMVRIYFEGRNFTPYVVSNIIEIPEDKEKEKLEEGLY
jgi:glycosyltransferase involved in cell wall biosynthesis